MSGVLLAVRWSPGTDEDRRPIKWVQSAFLPKLLGTTSVTIGRKTRSTETWEQASEGHKRHEARHVWQQAGQFVPWWLIRYVLLPSFRKRMEADAKQQEDASVTYPQFRIIGIVH